MSICIGVDGNYYDTDFVECVYLDNGEVIPTDRDDLLLEAWENGEIDKEQMLEAGFSEVDLCAARE